MKDRKDSKQSTSEEVSILWLKVRQSFLLGRDQWMYPKDMLRYHYGNVPERYWESRNLSPVEQSPRAKEVNLMSETDNKTLTTPQYEDDEFDEPSEIPSQPTAKKSSMLTSD